MKVQLALFVFLFMIQLKASDDVVKRCKSKAVRTAIAVALQDREGEKISLVDTYSEVSKKNPNVIIYNVNMDICSVEDQSACGGVSYEVIVNGKDYKCKLIRTTLTSEE